MKFEKKYFGILTLVAVFSTFFSFSLPVQAEGEDGANICNGAIPEVGYKFIKVLLSDNNSGPSGGQPACVKVPESQNSVSFAELGSVIPREWAGYTIDKQGLYCDPIQTPQERIYDVQRWYSLEHGGLYKASQLQLSTDQVCVRIGVNNIFVTHSESTYTNKQPLRYEIQFSNENSNKYLYIVGVQKINESEKAAKEACLLNFKREMSQCIPQDYNPSADTPASLLEKMKKNSSLPAGCIDAINACILGSTTVASSTPQAPTLAELHANDPHYQKPKGYNGPLPDCAFSYEGCRNINDFLRLFINLGKSLFALIGTFAFVMFVYGGFTMVLSMGNAEKVKKGRDVLVASIVGIIIAFGAYLIVDFILDALQVSDLYRAVGNLETDLTQPKK